MLVQTELKQIFDAGMYWNIRSDYHKCIELWCSDKNLICLTVKENVVTVIQFAEYDYAKNYEEIHDNDIIWKSWE